jgi:hypothetical protein
MESCQLNKIVLVTVVTLLAGTFALGQCKTTRVDYDPVDISELTVFQKQKAEVETSENHIDIFYLVMGVNPIGYRLIIRTDGSYKLSKDTKENAITEVRSGILKPAEMEKLEGVSFAGVTHFLGKCKGITSSESTELFLIKKNGTVKIYSLDGELERTLKEDDPGGTAYCFELLTCLMKRKA